MSDENTSSSGKPDDPKVQLFRCIGIAEVEGGYELRVFTLKNSKVVDMEIISAADKLDAGDKFKINAQKKILGPLVRGESINGKS